MKCHFCGESIDTEEELLKHLDEVHFKELKNLNFTAKQSYYHHKNRFKLKRIGICGCGSRKKWLEESNKYEYYCFSDSCKNKMNQVAINNNITKFGVAKPFEMVEVQMKAMETRGKSMYVWGPGNDKFIILNPTSLEENPTIQDDINDALSEGAIKYVYLSKVEELVLKELLKIFDKKDIEAPFSKVIHYTYPGQEFERNHIPDIFVKSLNLIISCKDSMLHPNRHHNMVEDRFKSLFEYQAILNTTDYNFFQIDGEDDIVNLRSYLNKVKQMHATGSRYIAPPKVDVFVLISESIHADSLNNNIIEDITSVDYAIIGEHGLGFKVRNSNSCIFLHEKEGLYTGVVNEGLAIDLSKIKNDIKTYDEIGMREVSSIIESIFYDKEFNEDDILEELNGSIIKVIGGKNEGNT